MKTKNTKLVKKRKPRTLPNPFTLPCGATLEWYYVGGRKDFVRVQIIGDPGDGGFARIEDDWASHVELLFRGRNIPALVKLLQQIEKEHKQCQRKQKK